MLSSRQIRNDGANGVWGWEWCDEISASAVECRAAALHAAAFLPLPIFIFQSDCELHEYSTLICSTVASLYLTGNFP